MKKKSFYYTNHSLSAPGTFGIHGFEAKFLTKVSPPVSAFHPVVSPSHVLLPYACTHLCPLFTAGEDSGTHVFPVNIIWSFCELSSSEILFSSEIYTIFVLSELSEVLAGILRRVPNCICSSDAVGELDGSLTFQPMKLEMKKLCIQSTELESATFYANRQIFLNKTTFISKIFLFFTNLLLKMET